MGSKDNTNYIDTQYFEGKEGSSCNLKYFPSPPPISNLSNSAEVIDPGFMLSNLKEVHPVKSWGSRESGHSANDEKCSVHSNDTDGIVFIDHNLRRMNLSNQQRVRRSMSALKLSELAS